MTGNGSRHGDESGPPEGEVDNHHDATDQYHDATDQYHDATDQYHDATDQYHDATDRYDDVPGRYDDVRYLAAKRTVDDRALHRGVLERFREELADRATDDEGSLHLVEVGAGIGTNVARMLEWGLLPAAQTVRYTLVDVDADALVAARDRIPRWARDAGYAVTGSDSQDGPEGALTLEESGQDGGRHVRVRTRVGDAIEAVGRLDPEPDAVVGMAVIDLLGESAVGDLFARLPADCLCYFPITFDGGTVFEPTTDRAFESHLIERYHRDMRTRDTPGDPHAGRKLLARVANDRLLAAGGSDWTVASDLNGYAADEAYFCHHIVHTVASALADDPAVDDDRLATWADTRHRQISDRTLVYVAHQLDVLCLAGARE